MFDPVPDPAPLGFDAARLRRIGPWMQGWVDSGRLPGMQVVVARRGRVVVNACTGFRDVEAAAPWTSDTVVRIYSMTKPIVSAALLSLWEEARCHLDTPLDAFLPEFAAPQVLVPGATALDQTRPAETRLTLHHLLTHTSGLTYGFNEGLLAQAMTERGVEFSAQDATLAERTRQLAELPLAFEPGTRWNYGVSTDVIGRVVEVISGQPLDRFLAERILGPLGMDDTGFEVRADQLPRLASCYAKTAEADRALWDPASDSRFAPGRVRLFSGGGGLVSTAADYLRFAEMLRGGGALGATRILAPKTVALMTANALRGDLASMGQPVFSEVSFDGVGFGLGVSVTLDPALAKTAGSAGDFGWGGMASTVFWVDPALEMSAVLLTQLMPSSSWPIRKEIRALVHGALTHP